MLSLLSAAKKPASTLAEVLPWIDLVSDGLMLCKDGSLLASFEYGGLDFDNIQEDVLGGAMDQLLRSYAALDERITMWWSVSKRRDTSYPQNPFVNQAAQALDDLVEKHFDDGEVYCSLMEMFNIRREIKKKVDSRLIEIAMMGIEVDPRRMEIPYYLIKLYNEISLIKETDSTKLTETKKENDFLKKQLED